MFFVNFFLIACISALVAGNDYHWVPMTIPTASKQCKVAGNYHGVCDNNGGPHNPKICTKMLCAEFTGKSYIGIPIRAMDGTICGASSVCKKHKCVPIPHNKLPVEQYRQHLHKCECASPSTGD